MGQKHCRLSIYDTDATITTYVEMISIEMFTTKIHKIKDSSSNLFFTKTSRSFLADYLHVNLSGVFQGVPEPTKPTAPRPLLSLYGIIYVTWYTSGLPEATGVRLRLPNSHALLGSGRPCKTPLYKKTELMCKESLTTA